jgi:hypothetical protein
MPAPPSYAHDVPPTGALYTGRLPDGPLSLWVDFEGLLLRIAVFDGPQEALIFEHTLKARERR